MHFSSSLGCQHLYALFIHTGHACHRGFFSSAAPLAADGMAEEAQKKAGNPYAPTDSAGGTPTDNQADESRLLPLR